jgi:hypothetical protein
LKERIEALKDKAKSNTDLLTRLTAKVAKLADIPNSKWAEHKDVGGGIEMLPIPVGHYLRFLIGVKSVPSGSEANSCSSREEN